MYRNALLRYPTSTLEDWLLVAVPAHCALGGRTLRIDARFAFLVEWIIRVANEAALRRYTGETWSAVVDLTAF